MPINFRYTGFQGTLSGPMMFENLCYKNQSIKITLKKTVLDWSPLKLLTGILNVEKLHGIGIDLYFFKKKFNAEKAGSTKVKLPPNVFLKDISMSNLNVHFEDSHTVAVNEVNAKIFSDNKSFNIDIDGMLGEEKFKINGGYHGKWDMAWNMRLSDLEHVLPSAKGSLSFEGQISGKKNSPHILALASARNFKINNFYSKHASAKIDASLLSDNKSKMVLKLTGTRLKNIILPRLNFVASGNVNEQIAHLSMDLMNNSIEMLLSGKGGKEKWNGSVKNLKVTSYKNTKWKTSKETSLFIRKNAVKMSPLCLYSNDNTVCTAFQGAWDNIDRFRIFWKVRNLDLLNEFMINGNSFFADSGGEVFVNGHRGKLHINGNFSMKNGRLELPNLNMHFSPVTINGAVNNNKLNFTAVVNSKNTKLNIYGKSILSDLEKMTVIQLQSDSFLIADTPEYNITVSPDVTIGLNKSHAHFSGKVMIPKAKIRPNDYSNIVEPSSDLIYEGEASSNAPDYKLDGHINFIVGDDVNVNAKNISGKLSGNLKVIMDLKNMVFAKGTLSLAQGVYQAYGQKLIIDKGKFIYNNSPITDPDLDFSAIKKIKVSDEDTISYKAKNLIVGLKIRGELSKPRISLFSTPPGLLKKEILSYLIVGEASSKQEQIGSVALESALTALASGKDSGIIGKKIDDLKQHLGISDIAFETKTSNRESKNILSDSSFIVGKYLSPKLYVRYGIGIVNPINTLFSRYSLTKNLSISTESNAIGSGIDILYSIER